MYFDSDTRLAFRISREQFLGKVNARIAEIDAAMTDKVRMAKVAAEYQKQLKEAATSVDVSVKKVAELAKVTKKQLKKLGTIKQPTYEQLQNFAGYCSPRDTVKFLSTPVNDYLAAYCHWVRQMQQALASLRRLKGVLEMATDDKISVRNHSMQSMMKFLSEELPTPETSNGVYTRY